MSTSYLNYLNVMRVPYLLASPPFPALAGVPRSDSVASPSSLAYSYLRSQTDSFSLQVRPKNNQCVKKLNISTLHNILKIPEVEN